MSSALRRQQHIKTRLNSLYSYEKKEYETYKRKGTIIYYTGTTKEVKRSNYTKFLDNILAITVVYNVIKSDHVQFRYELIDILGSGCSCEVVRAIDHKLGQFVAIKIFKLNNNIVQEMYNRECRHLRIINAMYRKKNTNIVELLDNFYFRRRPFIVFELLGTPLSKTISNNTPLKTVKSIVIQLVKGLMVLNKVKVIHGDLKPENVLFIDRENTIAKIVDFGGSSLTEDGTNKCRTLHYMPPELLLQMRSSTASDIWTLGVIIIQLVTGFRPFKGFDRFDQMSMYVEAFGLPPDDLISNSPARSTFFWDNNDPRYCTNEDGSLREKESILRGYPATRTLPVILARVIDPVGLNFVMKCLTWRPADRMSIKDMLDHSWLAAASKKGNGNHQEPTFLDALPDFFIKILQGCCIPNIWHKLNEAQSSAF